MGGGGGLSFSFLIPGSVLDYAALHKNVMFIFITIFRTLWCTNTISNTITGSYWPQKTAHYDNRSSHICHQWHSRCCKILYQKFSAPRPLSQQYAMLVDYNVHLYNDTLNIFLLMVIWVFAVTDLEKRGWLDWDGINKLINKVK